LAAQGTHGLGNAGSFAVDEVASGLGGAVARAQAGATDGENEGRAQVAEIFKVGGDQVFVVGNDAGAEFGVRPLAGEERGNGGACCVSEQALRTAVGDGEDGEQHGAIVKLIWRAEP
jgi:hypothetical protein